MNEYFYENDKEIIFKNEPKKAIIIRKQKMIPITIIERIQKTENKINNQEKEKKRYEERLQK